MKKTIKKIILLSLFLFCFPIISFAAEIFMQADNDKIIVEDEFIIDLSINTENDSLNAIEGVLTFPKDLLEVKEIRNADSIINFWIQEPQSLNEGKVSFSGITPGGFSGSDVPIFSIVFLAKKAGGSLIDIDEIKILRNDGKGTEVDGQISPLSLTILPKSSSGSSDSTKVDPILDTEPPEDFIPTISSDPNVFEGKHFLVFVAQDKGSGVDYYEVKEGFFGKFIIAKSPYLLTNQNLDKKIYVKAVDVLKNERVTLLSPQNAGAWYQQYEIFAILVLIGIVLFALKKLWSRFFA